jgi:hypothetical protein
MTNTRHNKTEGIVIDIGRCGPATEKVIGGVVKANYVAPAMMTPPDEAVMRNIRKTA